MKALLGCLMCLVFTISQSFAISGGPFSGPKGRVSVIGTYAGILEVDHDLDKLGIFTLSVPQTGLATGTVTIFTGCRTFSGPITGLADPNTDSLVANLQAIPVVTSGSTTIETLDLHADGTIQAKIKNSRMGFTISSVRLRGTALVTTDDVNGICGTAGTSTAVFTVAGFKQSLTPGGG